MVVAGSCGAPHSRSGTRNRIWLRGGLSGSRRTDRAGRAASSWFISELPCGGQGPLFSLELRLPGQGPTTHVGLRPCSGCPCGWHRGLEVTQPQPGGGGSGVRVVQGHGVRLRRFCWSPLPGWGPWVTLQGLSRPEHPCLPSWAALPPPPFSPRSGLHLGRSREPHECPRPRQKEPKHGRPPSRPASRRSGLGPAPEHVAPALAGLTMW